MRCMLSAVCLCDEANKTNRIMFMREFPIIDSAVSVEQLRMRLKDNEFEQFGEQFTPDFVYDVIRRLPRFSNMKVRNMNWCH